MTEMARIEKVLLLQRVDLLSACRAEQILRMSAIARPSAFAEGEVIHRAGQPATRFYVIESGSVEISDSDTGARQLGAADTFGAADILCGRMRTRTATARDNTRVLAIEAEDFFDLLANNIEIVKALFRQRLEDPSDGRTGQAGR